MSLDSRQEWLTRRIAAWLLVVAWSCGPIQRADCADVHEAGDAVSALKAVNDIEWSAMVVKVIDVEGNPLQGAVVRPWALRAGNRHVLWTEEMYGAPRQTRSDAAGRAEVVFPKVPKTRDEPHVSEVSVYVSHDEFCTSRVDVDVPSGEPPIAPSIALERGVRLRIAGVEPGSEKPLPHCHVLLEGGESFLPEFLAEPDGWMKSTPVKENRRWFRVVRTPAGEPPQFSKAMAWTPDDPLSREVRAEVRPGVRVVGMISDNVPRPITRGRVVAWCGSPSRIESNVEGGRTQPIWWIDTVPVREDGSFEFASLPTGYLAQMYAFANDFISSQPTDAAYKICCDWFASQDQERQRNHFFRYGQVLRLAGAKSRITLDMEPAGQVMVRCVDIISGEPVAGIIVGSSPNQYTVGGGSTIFCQGQRTLDCLLEGERILKHWRQDSPYSAVTDINGEALIQNLPQGHQSFVARNDRWESRQGRHGVEAVPGKIVRLNISLQRIP